jgi:AsmA-like C-terminal region
MKKLLIGIVLLLLIIVGALVAIPVFFKDEIVAQIKIAANESLNAKLDFTDVDVSVFRNFPKLSVGLQELDIMGIGVFDGTRLIHCKKLDVAVDFWDALYSKTIIIKGLHLEEANVHVFVMKDGKANYDISKPTPANKPATTETSSSMKLEQYSLTNSNIIYEDRSLNMVAELKDLNHKGKGDFEADLYDLVMTTEIGKMSVNYEGVQYLRNAHAYWDATIGADMKNMKFTMKDNKLKVNDLALNLEGWTQLPNDKDVLMDLKFGTPQNTFKSLLSIIPGAYTKDFAGVQANGSVQFDGFAKGKYNEKTYPAFQLDFKVGNADFKYPSLPLGVSRINVDASIKSPSTHLNAMTVNIPKFSLQIGSNPLEGYFNLKTPESDPTIDTKIKGTLNLAELTKAFPVEGVQELSGIFKADLIAKAAMSQIDAQQYEQVNMAGKLSMENINYHSAGTPAIKINQLSMDFSPKMVDIQNFDAKLGKSDLKANGRIDNILAYFSTEKTMRGTMNFQSGYFDANEWMEPAPTGTADAGKIPTDPTPSSSEKVFDRWDFDMDGKINRLKYDVYDLTEVATKGHFTPNKMDISNFGMKIGASDLSGNGQIMNAWNYLFDNQTVSGVVNLNSNYFDMNQFMTEEPAKTTQNGQKTGNEATPVEEIIPVPENMTMTLNAKMAKVLYTNLNLANLDGQILVRDRVASLKDCTADVIGGQIGLTGEYNTQNLAKPQFNMDMALQNMGFKEAYNNFVTIKSFAPIAQLLDGKFNTTLSLSGLLGKDMMPDMKTLSAAGFLQTINALLNNFKPMQDIGNKLNVEYLKKMEIKDSKNWFEIKDGMLTIKPFDLQMKDVAMKITGSHGLTNEMNYQISTKTPRSAIEKNPVGAAASAGLGFLTKEAGKYGVNINQGEFINVLFNISGSLFNPKIDMKVLGSDGTRTIKEEATATVEAVKQKALDSLNRVANKELNVAKDKANKAIDKVTDSLKTVANKAIEDAKNKATETVKEEVGKVISKEVGDKVGTEVGKKIEEKAGQVLGDKGQKSVEEVKDKLNNWNPLKKKKN